MKTWSRLRERPYFVTTVDIHNSRSTDLNPPKDHWLREPHYNHYVP